MTRAVAGWRALSLPLRVAVVSALATAVGLAVTTSSLRAAVSLSEGALIDWFVGSDDQVDPTTAERLARAVGQTEPLDFTGMGPSDNIRLEVRTSDTEEVIAGGRVADLTDKVLAGPEWQEARDALDAERGEFWLVAIGLPQRLTYLLLALGGVVVVLSGVLTGVAARAALGPVAQMRREVERIGTEDLDRRLEVPPSRDELQQLARTMNSMLQRLHEASDRQRRFIADASHELRSPVAGLRTAVDVGIQHPDRVDARDVLEDVAEATDRLERLVVDLLDLAVLAEASVASRHVPVDLDDVVLTSAARVRRAHPEIVITTRGVGGARVSGDPNALERLVDNLLGNAARYGHGRIEVSLWAAGAHARLAVDDDGPGIAPEDREQVFEPFVRLDEARARKEGGTGLGLALVRGIAVRHDGDVVIGESPMGGARVVVRIPIADE